MENKVIQSNTVILTKVSNLISITNKIIDEIILIPYRKRNKWGFCTPDKKIIIDCVYQDAYQFIEDLARVKQNNKYGFIDKNGNIIIPLIYNEAFDFEDGLAVVHINGIKGIINKTNNFEKAPRDRRFKYKSQNLSVIDVEKSIIHIQVRNIIRNIL